MHTRINCWNDPRRAGISRCRTWRRFSLFIFLFVLYAAGRPAAAGEQEAVRKFTPAWFSFQMLPNCVWTRFPQGTFFSLEWEAAPLVYSFGMNKRVQRWHCFQVTQPERFAGSVELILAAQVFMKKIRTSYWGFSGQISAHLPLIEHGEYLGVQIGAARYTNAGVSSGYIVGGVSTLFGFFHYTVKYSPADKIWMNSIEFRFF